MVISKTKTASSRCNIPSTGFRPLQGSDTAACQVKTQLCNTKAMTVGDRVKKLDAECVRTVTLSEKEWGRLVPNAPKPVTCVCNHAVLSVVSKLVLHLSPQPRGRVHLPKRGNLLASDQHCSVLLGPSFCRVQLIIVYQYVRLPMLRAACQLCRSVLLASPVHSAVGSVAVPYAACSFVKAFAGSQKQSSQLSRRQLAQSAAGQGIVIDDTAVRVGDRNTFSGDHACCVT